MSAEQNKSMLKHIFSELNKGNFNVIDGLFAEDFVDRYPAPGETPNKEGFKQFLAAPTKASPTGAGVLRIFLLREIRSPTALL